MRELEWITASKSTRRALDGTVRYFARMQVNGVWTVRMNGAPVGGQHMSFDAVKRYVDWGGKPCRMGFDRETGEVQ